MDLLDSKRILTSDGSCVALTSPKAHLNATPKEDSRNASSLRTKGRFKEAIAFAEASTLIRRLALSTPTLVAVVLLVVIVGAGYYVLGQGGGGQPTSTSVSSATVSSVTSSSSRLSSSSSGRVIMVFVAPNVLVSSDVVANYTMTVTTLGSVPSALNLAAAAPPGITVTLDPSQFTAGGPPRVRSPRFRLTPALAREYTM